MSRSPARIVESTAGNRFAPPGEGGFISLEELHASLEAIPAGICIYDQDDRLEYFNEQYRRIYRGHAGYLVLGKKFEEMLRAGVLRGEFADAIGQEEQWIRHRLEQHLDPPEFIEQELSSGRWLQIKERHTKNGKIVGFRTDITEIKLAELNHQRNEERFRDYADSAGDWYWEMDSSLRFSFMSENVERIAGVPPEWHYGKTRNDLLGSEANKDPWVDHLQTLSKHEPFRDFEYERIGPNGRKNWIRTSGKPIFDMAGSFLGYRGCATDITEQKIVQQRLKQSEEQLLQTQKMDAIGQLTGGVAHDFNNLMQVIMGNAELLIDDPSVDRQTLKSIINATERGAELTQRLLAYSRKQTLSPSVVDIGELASRMLSVLKRTLGASIKIDGIVPNDLWPALADPGQIETAILNLALNSSDALANGGTLQISCCNTGVRAEQSQQLGIEVGDYVSILVTDNGRGMDSEELAKATEPFFTTKPTGKGSGLGLSMVDGFARQSGGCVTIDSKLGEGTRVEIFIPKASEAEETRPSPR